MTGEKKVQVTIDKFGNTRVEAVGFKGEACLKTMQPISDAVVGKKPLAEAHTSEFYESVGKIAERELS